jgi:transposase
MKTTFEQISLLHGKHFKIVMDKGFYSSDNINYLLNEMPNFKFLISAPLHKSNCKLFATKAPDLDQNKYKLFCDGEEIHGKHVRYKWDDKHFINLYLYVNKTEYLIKENELYQKLFALKTVFESNINKYYEDSEHQKFFYIKRKKNFSTTGEYIVQLNRTEINKSLQNIGKLIIFGNEKNLTARDALEVYRSKDVVEKGFHRFKSNLDLRRIRVDSQKGMCNKEFICFLSQILLSYLDHKMSSNGLYDKMSLHKLILKFQSLRLTAIGGKRVLDPLSKCQRDILTAFKIDLPDKHYELLI